MSFNDPDSGLKQGKIIKLNDLNPEVTANFPSHGFPLQDADIANMSASKLLGGATNRFIRWIAGAAAWVTLLAADITAILGYTPTNPANYDTANNPPTLDGAGHIKRAELNLQSADVTGALGFIPENIANKEVASGYKGIDANSNLSMVGLGGDILMQQGLALNAVKGFLRIPTCAGVPTGIPTNGNGSLIYDTTDNVLYVYSGGWLAAGGGAGTSEVQFLQGKAASGKLIMVSGYVNNPAATSTLISYTPANGATFVLYRANVLVQNTSAGIGESRIELRNNGTIVGSAGSYVISNTAMMEFVVKGDQLVGNGTIIYDIFNVTAFGDATSYAIPNMCGYLL